MKMSNMKKMIFLVTLSTIALCACGLQDSPIEQNESGITSEAVTQIHPPQQEATASISTSTLFGRADFSTISAGEGSSMAIDKEGTLWGWGCNYGGELGVGYGEDSKYSDQVHSFYLEEDLGLGSRKDKTYEYYDRPIAIMDDVVAVDTGKSSLMTLGGGATLALKKDGTLWGWGYNQECRLGSPSFSEDGKVCYTPIMILDRVVAMSMGRNVACAIRTDHKLWAWENDFTKDNPQIVAEDVISACAANKEIAFIKEDQTLWLTNGLNASSAKHIADHVKSASPVNGGVIYLTSDGILYGLGYNTTGLFSNETGNTDIPVIILEDIVSFSVTTNSGADFAVAITSDGTLYGWGCNNSGQLGNYGGNDIIDVFGNARYTTPTIIDHNVVSASCGVGYTLILKNNGTLYACGANGIGQLGIGQENGNEYNKELNTHWQTVPIAVMSDIMLPNDNAELYNSMPVYSKWEGMYYGKKADFKNYTMTISYGMNDGTLTCVIAAEDDTRFGTDRYSMNIDPNNPNYAYTDTPSRLILEFNSEFVAVTDTRLDAPHSRFYKTEAEREASATEEIDLDDLLGTWVFQMKIFGILSIFKENDSYYLNFYYSHSGSPSSDAYLRAPVELISQDGVAVANYPDDNCGNSGTIRIVRDVYGKYFLSGSVDGMDDALAEEYKFANQIPALVVSNEEMIRNDEVKTWTIFRHIDPSITPRSTDIPDVAFLLDTTFYKVSDYSEYLEFTLEGDQTLSFSIYAIDSDLKYEGAVNLYDIEIDDVGMGLFSFSGSDRNMVAVNMYCQYDGICYIKTSDGYYDITVFQ